MCTETEHARKLRITRHWRCAEVRLHAKHAAHKTLATITTATSFLFWAPRQALAGHLFLSGKAAAAAAAAAAGSGGAASVRRHVNRSHTQLHSLEDSQLDGHSWVGCSSTGTAIAAAVAACLCTRPRRGNRRGTRCRRRQQRKRQIFGVCCAVWTQPRGAAGVATPLAATQRSCAHAVMLEEDSAHIAECEWHGSGRQPDLLRFRAHTCRCAASTGHAVIAIAPCTLA
jgi:hypothetical protein